MIVMIKRNHCCEPSLNTLCVSLRLEMFAFGFLKPINFLNLPPFVDYDLYKYLCDLSEHFNVASLTGMYLCFCEVNCLQYLTQSIPRFLQLFIDTCRYKHCSHINMVRNGRTVCSETTFDEYVNTPV